MLAVRKEYAGIVVLKSEDAAAPLDFVLSTPAVDRTKDTIDQAGWKLDNFRKNPVVLWAHDSSAPPIAKAPTLLVEVGTASRLLARGVEFVSREIGEAVRGGVNGWAIGQMYRQGFLNAVSVGFLPSKFVWNQDRGDYAMDFLEQELLEFSACPVPANPEALIGAKAAGIPIEWVREWAEKVLDSPIENDGFKPPRVALLEEMRAVVAPKTFQVPRGKDAADDADAAADAALLEQMASLEAALIANTSALSANTAAILLDVAADAAGKSAPVVPEARPIKVLPEVTGDSIAAEITRQLSTLTGRT